MKVLLDEDVPQPLVDTIKRLLRGHEVAHVRALGWRGKRDFDVYKDGRARGFDAIVTNDLAQLNDPIECRAIRDSRMHHIRYELDDGLIGLGLAAGAICAAIRPIVEELDHAPSQRLVRIIRLSRPKRRFEVQDPTTDPPRYWP